MRYLLTAALLITSATLTVVASAPAPAQAQVRVNIGVPWVQPVEPYYYSRGYCDGCWYGDWEGRRGYHRGGGRPWEREHEERMHYRHGGYRGDNGRHEGHHS